MPTPHGLHAQRHQHAEIIVAERALERLGLPVPTDPTAALQRAVDAANGLHIGLEALVREAVAGGDGSRQLVARLAMYADATDRLARVAKSAVDANLTERAITFQHAQGAFLLEMVNLALGACIPPELHVPFRTQLADRMRKHLESDSLPLVS